VSKLDDVKKQLRLVAKLGSASALSAWDEEVNLPAKGRAYRGQVNAYLATELHRAVTAEHFVGNLKRLANPDQFKTLSADQQVIVRQTWRDVRRQLKLPEKFVAELAELTSKAFGDWLEARRTSNFGHFAPTLAKIIELKRRQAELLGYKDSPYDALLDDFEPGMTARRLDQLFKPLAGELMKLVARLKAQSPAKLPAWRYDQSAQQKLNQAVAADLGYDLKAGRIDASPHPFTMALHPTDVRITTRYDEAAFWGSLGSVIHEVGHALYEQGLPARHFGIPLGQAVSLGVHESQSRLWENFVGKSRPFVDYLYPLLVKHFGRLPYSAEQLYLWLNRVEPSLIRVEADEVTYNLHIILRYELERDLIEGRLPVADLPSAWNQKMKQYLGLPVPDDASGALQDIHWSHGYFGYFPTYSLGNLYAAQLYAAALKTRPGLEKGFAKGDFKDLLSWLRVNIHKQGRRYPVEELIQKVTGQKPMPGYLQKHLAAKLKLQNRE